MIALDSSLQAVSLVYHDNQIYTCMIVSKKFETIYIKVTIKINLDYNLKYSIKWENTQEIKRNIGIDTVPVEYWQTMNKKLVL